MAVDLNFLDKRVRELEKIVNRLTIQIEGAVSHAAVQQLMALRQQDIIEIKDELARLTTIIDNYIGQP